MGSVTSYETADGKRYRVRYRTPDRRQTDKRGFRTKKEAELYLAGVEIRKATGEFIDASDAKVTVSDLGAVWLAAQTHMKPSSFGVVETAWRLHVQPVWGHRQVGLIRHSDVQAWVSKLGVGKSATVVLRSYGVLAGILDTAVKDRRVSSNVARGVNLPRKNKLARHYLTHEQVGLLASGAGQHSTLVLFLAYTGLRWGEAVALQVGALDMLRRRSLVQANAVRVGGQVLAGTPKSHEARSVPFPAFLGELLAEHCAGKSREQLVFGQGLVFLRTPAHGDGWFAQAKKRAAAVDADFPPLTIHALRHTAASLAISAGANVKAVQRMLGHASAAMTLDTYADLFDDDLDAVAVALDQARTVSNVGKMWALASEPKVIGSI